MNGRIWILCRIPAIEDKTLTDNKRNLPAIGIEAVTALNGSRTREGRRCKLTAIGLELDIVLPSQRIIEVDKDRPSRYLLLIPDKVLNIEIEVTRNTSFRIRTPPLPLSQHQKEQRMASVKPKLNEFFDYVGSIATEISRKSLLGTAVSYALSMQDDRMAYLMDGRLTLSNNACKRKAMKPFVIGRKN